VLPLLALGLTYVIGPWAIAPIVVMAVLSLLPFDLPGDAAV
jgi:hypothetical protein